MSINNCVFTGNLGKIPEIRTTQSGKKVASASLAVTTGWGDNKKTSWIRLIAWEKTAEIMEKYCDKGDRIGVVCELNERQYEADGQTKYVTEFTVRSLELLSDKSKGDQSATIQNPGVDELLF